MSVKRRKDSKNRILKEGEYERSNKTYEFKWTDKIGKRHSIYAKTLEELREKEIDILRDNLNGIKVNGKNLTVNDFYKKWESLKRGLKNNTFQNYKYMYNQFAKDQIGNIKVCELKRTDVRSFYNMLQDVRHLKLRTIECLHTVIHQILELAVEDDCIRYNPSDNALKELKRAHNKDVEKRKAFTKDEQKIFENYLKKEGLNHRWYPVFIVMLWTGLRVGELTGLTWNDIDFENNTITVSRTLVYYDKGGKGKCGYAIHTPKTNAGNRVVPMIEKVRLALLEEQSYQKELGIKCVANIDGYTDFVFINRYGTTHNQATLNKALRRIIRDCNYEIMDKGNANSIILPNVSNHSLRHTFTTRMLEAGINVKVMQEVLGHADAQTTMNIYAEAKQDFIKEELNKFEKYFN